MKTVVIGPGRIGCGFAGQLLRASGHEITFLGRDEALVNHLNRVGRYRVRLENERQSCDVVVDGVRAVRAAKADEAVRELAAADLIVTAVGPGNLPDTAPLIAQGLAKRNTPVNVIAFENLSDGGGTLRGHVARHLPADFPIAQHGFSGTVVSRAVTQRLGNPAEDEPLVFVGDPFFEFAVSRPALRVPIPAIEGMILAEDLTAWMKRKLYIYSAGHATCAYLGFLKGYHYIHTAIRDPEIRAAVLAAMREGQRGIAASYGTQFAGGETDLMTIVARFQNAALPDPIARVGRDPTRKLAPEDRLVGAARLAQEAGVRPEQLVLAAAAACCFDPADPSAAELQREIRTSGLGAALQRVTGLDVRRGLGRLLEKRWEQLSRDWRRNNVLLSLDSLVWAWKPGHWRAGRSTQKSTTH